MLREIGLSFWHKLKQLNRKKRPYGCSLNKLKNDYAYIRKQIIYRL